MRLYKQAMKERIHEKLLTRCDQLDKWYLDRLQGQYEPFYASFDVRDAGFKIGNIDGNIYPLGLIIFANRIRTPLQS
jgi:glutamate--cysteine ligase